MRPRANPKPKKPSAAAPASAAPSSMYTSVDMPTTEEVNKTVALLNDARIFMMMKYPFFGFMMYAMKDKVGTRVSRAGTDGVQIFWNPKFVNTLDRNDVVFVMAHEVMHCALMHLWRTKGKDEDVWNQATDAFINEMLLTEAGFSTKITDMVRRKGAAAESAEAIYEDLMKKQKEKQKGPKGPPGKPGKPGEDDDDDEGGGGGGGGGGRDEKGLQKSFDVHTQWAGSANETAQRQIADEWKQVLTSAKKMGGSIPASLNRLIDQITDPKIDWRLELFGHLSFQEDYSWSRPDRRFLHTGIILPSLHSEKSRVVVVVDTSGSVTGDLLATFWSEVVGIMQNNNIEGRVILADAAVLAEYEAEDFTPGVVIKGGGGTNFIPAFEKIYDYMSYGYIPTKVIYITDLMGTFPPDSPLANDTIWVVTEQDAENAERMSVRGLDGTPMTVPPWGKVLRIPNPKSR